MVVLVVDDLFGFGCSGLLWGLVVVVDGWSV